MPDDMLQRLAEIQNQGKAPMGQPGVAQRSTNVLSAIEPPKDLKVNTEVPEDQLQTQQDQVEIAMMLDPRSDKYDSEKGGKRERERFPERYIDHTGAQPEDGLGLVGPEIGKMILPDSSVKNEISEADDKGNRELKTESGSIKFRQRESNNPLGIVPPISPGDITVEGDMQEQKESVLGAIQNIQKEFGTEGNIPLWHPYWGLKNKLRSYPETAISQMKPEDRRVEERREGESNKSLNTDEALLRTRPSA